MDGELADAIMDWIMVDGCTESETVTTVLRASAVVLRHCRELVWQESAEADRF